MRKEDCSDFENETLVKEVQEKVATLRANMTKEYEMQKEAMIQSFSQEFAMA